MIVLITNKALQSVKKRWMRHKSLFLPPEDRHSVYSLLVDPNKLLETAILTLLLNSIPFQHSVKRVFQTLRQSIFTPSFPGNGS